MSHSHQAFNTFLKKAYNNSTIRNNTLPYHAECAGRHLKAMYPSDINKLLRNNTRFKGTYDHNTIPQVQDILHKWPQDWCIIVNTLTTSSPRTDGHWIAIAQTDNGNSHFFDSYGRMPMFSGWTHILQSLATGRGGQVDFNSKAVQAFDTNSCGYFCVEYCNRRFLNDSLSDTEIVKRYIPSEETLCLKYMK